MKKPTALLFEANKDRKQLILQQAAALNITVHVISDGEAFSKYLSLHPHLILVNTDDPVDVWHPYLQPLIHRRVTPPVGVLGYSQAKDAVQRLNALDLGCDNVVSQRAIEKNLHLQWLRHARPVDLDDLPPTLPQGIREGIELFNQGRFHPAHDAIEPVWLKEKRGIRLLYAGILQVGIAYHFIEHQGYAQALRMFGHGRAKLVPFFPNTLGINTQGLYEAASASFYKLKMLGAGKIGRFSHNDFPKITLMTNPLP